jgi:serine/threonine protein kinase
VDIAPGTRLGRYEIVAAIGAGGMGEVFRARDARLGREVAIKVLPGRLMSAPDARDRFEREAQVVAALAHPNILAIYDFGEQDGCWFAVMELLVGQSLGTRLRQGPVPLPSVLACGVQIAR